MNNNQLLKSLLDDDNTLTVRGELLFNHADALKILDEAEKRNIVILGIDFWQERGTTHVEVNSTAWDNINQGRNASKDTIREARQLIGQGLPNKIDYVSFVLEEKQISSSSF